jgi:aspartate/methionine/tyrosine aminotransferase
LREAFASELRQSYGGSVGPEQILITAGCSQAFAVTASSLTEAGDNMALALPYYFDHVRWLQLDQARCAFFGSDDKFIPDIDAAQRVISDRTRAIVLVSPGNPTGVTIPHATTEAFADLARDTGTVLIIDETYRAFTDPNVDPPHRLFHRADWSDYVVSLHSFSKDFAIPGLRVGAVVADSTLIDQALKVHSCTAICAPRIGQEAALAGLLGASDWRAARVAEIRRKHDTFGTVMAVRPGRFELVASGGYFGWVRHPFVGEPSESVADRLVSTAGIHVLPGTAFMPTDERYLRFSYAGVSREELEELPDRLGRMS